MVAQHAAHRHDSLMDAVLSAVVPGLGQLNQQRFAAAAHFFAEAVLLAVIMLAAPQLGVAAVIGLIGVTAWSVIDAYRGAR